ncbi:MAG TPA: hypothetical protein PLH84_08710 [Candidatus Krumholzibacteria bacterium]|nr:hypothetical protein [Candidatus Krumholzibacteria bacterium]
MNAVSRIRRNAGRVATLLSTIAVALTFAVVPAAADPFVWILPDGQQTWTAGTTHSITWAGGTSFIGALAVYPVGDPFSPLLLGQSFSNIGSYTWAIDPNTAPGSYFLRIVMMDDSFFESTPFTIGPPLECLSGCSLVSASTPMADNIAGTLPQPACGATAQEAAAAAEAYVMAQFDLQCFSGYAVDPGSLNLQVTFLPGGDCLSGTGGIYYAEATAVGCCCPDAVPDADWSWSDVKAYYR